MNPRSCLLVVAGLLLAAGLMIPARAKEPDRICAQTVYLPEPIEGCNHITIVGDLDGQGTLHLDSNQCSVDEFGDRDMCTLVGYLPLQVTITDTKTNDRRKRGRKLYAIQGPRLRIPLFLAVSSDPTKPARLIYNRAVRHPVVVTLEPLPDPNRLAAR